MIRWWFRQAMADVARLIVAALWFGAAALLVLSLSGCGSGPVSKDWSPEAKKAGNMALIALGNGLFQIATGPDGYLDPDNPAVKSLGLGVRLGSDLALAFNGFETAADLMEWGQPTELPPLDIVPAPVDADAGT